MAYPRLHKKKILELRFPNSCKSVLRLGYAVYTHAKPCVTAASS